MIKLNDLIPVNLEEEKAKFFIDQTYNPQFKYAIDIPVEELTKFGLPKPEYLDLAQQILDEAFDGRTEKDIRKMEGRKIRTWEAKLMLNRFLKKNSLQNSINVEWSNKFVSGASYNSKIKTLKIKLPFNYGKKEFLATLYHELGTHALRYLNYQQQPWYKKKKKYGFSDHLRTEEGLASLHSLLAKNFKLAYKPAMRYLACNYALDHSFVELWDFLKNYITDPEERWMVAFRQKRGIRDSSKPAAYSKDISYFEGLVEVYHWLKNNNFDLTKLYFGKIAAKDSNKVLELNPNFKPKLPVFFEENKTEYRQKITKIGTINHI
jgi:hypothetical protein